MRNPRRQLRIWWSEIDRVLLLLIGLLMVFGLVAVAAASPSSAQRLSKPELQLPPLHFFRLQLQWFAMGLVVMLGLSQLSRDVIRRGSILFTLAMLVALALVPFVGSEVNGARRWLNIGMSFQPSEFLKPAFAVTTAWILSWRLRDPNLPVIGISAGLLALIVTLMMMQPNLGDSVLYAGAWFVLVMLAGLPLIRVGVLGAVALSAMTATYFLYDNARHRIDSFFGGGTAYDQVDLAAKTLTAGGWTGKGLWLGDRKMRLPEAHTDYIFSVVGEEFGLLVCGVVVLLYLAIVLRILTRLVTEESLFAILSAGGLAALFGGQAFVNIMVNLQLFPSKGMTLPLVSYGGSSTIAQCITIGLLLAILRRNPYLSRDRFDLRGALEKDIRP